MLSNYETTRLLFGSPNAANLATLAVLSLLAVVSLRRSQPESFAGRRQTSQLKGVAILVIILSHVWVHVASARATLNLANYGIALFLTLSGFGLTLSGMKRHPSLGAFVKRRLGKVMLPYWVVTLLLLVLDGFLLRRVYAPKDLVATFLGINLNDVTRHIDYVRWFVTFILFWYVLFFIAMRMEERFHLNAAWVLLGCAVVLFPVDYYLTRLSWDEIFAFPAGCLLARHHGRLSAWFSMNRNPMLWAALLLGGAALACDLAIDSNAFPYLPSIVVKFAGEMNSLVLVGASLVIMAALSAAGYGSRFLYLCGTLTYGLFLLHGAVLVRYNPVFGLLNSRWLPLSFVFLLGLLLGVSYLVHKTVSV